MAGRFTILMVEDNLGDIELVRLALESEGLAGGLHVCENAVQAFCFLGKRDPFPHAPDVDLILLDLNLPVISGHRVLDTLQHSPKWCRIPVVVFTSSRLPADRQVCSRLGARRFVAKPALWDEYRALARRLRTSLEDGSCFQPLGGETATA